MELDRYPQTTINYDPQLHQEALVRIESAYTSKTSLDDIYEGVSLLHQMHAINIPELIFFKRIGLDPVVADDLIGKIEAAMLAPDQEELAMKLIDVSHLMSHTETPFMFELSQKIRPLSGALQSFAEFLGHGRVGSYNTGLIRGVLYDHYYLIAKNSLQAKKQAQAAQQTQTPPNPNTQKTPLTDWLPETGVNKSTDWVTARQFIEALWIPEKQTLKTDDTPGSTYDRFDRAFRLIHETILVQKSPIGTSLQAMVEYLIPEIWVKPEQVIIFFKQFENKGITNPEFPAEADKWTKAIFIPESLRSSMVPLEAGQKTDIRKLFRNYNKGFHDDVAKNNPDTNLDLDDYRREIYKAIQRAHKHLKLVLS